MSTEVELNLRLDPDCRTAFDPSTSTIQDIKTPTTIDYSSKTVLTSLADESKVGLTSSQMSDGEKQKQLDDLLFDCEITDCALLPRTFWMPCVGMEPRCALEKCAMEVFYHHVKQDQVAYDSATSGVEWWVQIRPSPSAGRYKLLVQDTKEQTKNSGEKNEDELEGHSKNKQNQNSSEEDQIVERGICFHWDKDEDLRLMMGGKMYIHPHISTVTYLSNIGAPTMALNYRVNALTGEYIIPDNDKAVEGYISWPEKGKHLSFDGRYLHAAPSDFMERGLFEKQIEIPTQQISELNAEQSKLDKTKKILERRHRRVTFLVNIWLNYKPFNVNPFPDSMIDKLSKADANNVTHFLFKNSDQNKSDENEQCPVKDHIYNESASAADIPKYQDFQWEMGSSSDKENISMRVPIDIIQNELGGNIKVSWSSNQESERGIRLSKDEANLDSKETKKQRLD